jgi:hypothetical protein
MDTNQVLETTCADCEGGWLHCHELLVVHADGTRACLGDPRCGAGPEAHEWRADCQEAGCACQAGPAPAPLARAA